MASYIHMLSTDSDRPQLHRHTLDAYIIESGDKPFSWTRHSIIVSWTAWVILVSSSTVGVNVVYISTRIVGLKGLVALALHCSESVETKLELIEGPEMWFKCMALYNYFPKQMPIHELCILADQSAALCFNCNTKLVELCQRDCVLTSCIISGIYCAPDVQCNLDIYNTPDTKSRHCKLGEFWTKLISVCHFNRGYRYRNNKTPRTALVAQNEFVLNKLLLAISFCNLTKAVSEIMQSCSYNNWYLDKVNYFNCTAWHFRLQ